MDPATILGALTAGAEILRLLVQGISYVERLFGGKSGQGGTKKEMVMGFAEIAFQAFGGQADKAKWEAVQPDVSAVIDGIVAILNKIK